MLLKSLAACALLASASRAEEVISGGFVSRKRDDSIQAATEHIARDALPDVQMGEASLPAVEQLLPRDPIPQARTTARQVAARPRTTPRRVAARPRTTLRRPVARPKTTTRKPVVKPRTTTRRILRPTPVVKPKTTTARQTTTSRTAAATTAPVNPVTPSQPGKRGLAYNNPQFTNPWGASPVAVNSTTALQSSSRPGGPSVSWTYNWFSYPCDPNHPVPGDECPHNPNLMHIPTLWGNEPYLLSIWNDAATAAIARGATHLFSFNEPDGCFTGSSCMDMPTAVALYKKHMQPFAGKALLGAPAVTNAGAPHGLDWLTRFMAQCGTGCRFDFINVHWYSNKYAGANYFKSFIEDVRKVAKGKPIWVTEFALNEENPFTDAENQAFLKEVMGWMDEQSDIAGYSYFMDNSSKWGLMNAAGTGLSALGQTYNSFSNGKVVGGPWGGQAWKKPA